MAFRSRLKSDGDPSLFVYMIGLETDPSHTRWDQPNNYYTLHYILSGEGFLNGIPLKEGQGFFMSKTAERKYFPSPLKPWTYAFISFDGEHAAHLLESINMTQDVEIFDVPFVYEVKNMMQSLSKLKTPEPKSPDTCIDFEYIDIPQSLAKSYFYKLLYMHEKSFAPITAIVPSHVINAERYMIDNFSKGINISDVAQHLNIDPKYLYKLFVKHYNTSPKQFLNNLRITRAMELLLNPDLPIGEISNSCGFIDSTQFSNFFKKHVGLSPTVFRCEKLDI